MSTREGRVRPLRDHPSRPEEEYRHDRGNNPPSRHLWVGNLSHSLNENTIARQFLQFGELESIAFQPGRSYAFINFRNEEDAFAAIQELQGFALAGNPLRIEFTKAEKSLASTQDESYLNTRGSPFTHDTRAHHSRPELSYLNKSKKNDKDEEPSEVLWIGFPAQLKVDEFVLRKAFASFGEIEKITAFPGRTYAFVRFRNMVSAYRAKEALQGKLLGNPRVRICFARNDSGPASRNWDSVNALPSPRGRSYGRSESYDNFRSEKDIDLSRNRDTRSPPYIPNLDPRDLNEIDLAVNANLWPRKDDGHEPRRFRGHGSEVGSQRIGYERPSSPRNLNAHIREFSPPNFPRQGPSSFDDPWDLPEDVTLMQGTKKLKTSTFHTETELPEYPLFDLEKEKRIIVSHDIPPSRVLDNNYDPKHSGYGRIPEHLIKPLNSFRGRSDHLNASHDDFESGSIPLPIHDRTRLAPDSRGSSAKEVWKWEGLIAKGGTPVCRARCFPVGKSPDMVLPEYIDCTARTSLDMLAKHYYQATSAWVVFFVPANDPDITYYNEFMNYLGEKQRAAVAKLDEKTTLFLVPPSELSEKVLKVPGKLSISGVVLRLDPPGTSYGSRPQTSLHGELAYQQPNSPSGPYLPTPHFPSYERPGITGLPVSESSSRNNKFLGTAHSISNAQSVSSTQNRNYDNAHGENWLPHDFQNPNSVTRNVPSHASNPAIDSMPHLYAANARPMPEGNMGNYTPDFAGNPGNGRFQSTERPPAPSSLPFAGLPAEKLAQLASSLLGQQGQLGGVLGAGEYNPSGNINQLGQSFGVAHETRMPNYEFPQSPYGQVQQEQQSLNVVASQRDVQSAAQMNSVQNGQDGGADADPQKRLQATLQLAASLLQQIQQGKGT